MHFHLDPARQIDLRARREGALARGAAFRAAQAFAFLSTRGSSIGGNRPKLTFIGWNERGPVSIASMWPPAT